MTQHIPVQLAEQDDKTWISMGDAARFLNITEDTLRGYVSRKVFQKSGQGKGTRVLLGDVRSYAERRDPARVAGGKIGGRHRKPRSFVSPNGSTKSEAKSAFELALGARLELASVRDKLEILRTREAELEEVIRATETIERFAKLSTSGLEE